MDEIKSRLAALLVVAAALLLPGAGALHAQRFNDLMVQYASMVITRTNIAVAAAHPYLYRHNLDVALGKGAFAVGARLQFTDHGAFRELSNDMGIASEVGVMLTARCDHPLGTNVRMESLVRVGVTPGIDYGQPLYATDTDLRLNVVAFAPDGKGWLGEKPMYPSAYVGAIVNHFGRVQGLTGVGVWWNKVGTYVTAFYAFNGIADPLSPVHRADRTFGMLQNGGISGSLSYDVGLFTFEFRRNVPLLNGSHDYTFSLRYRHFFSQGY